jgi:hypothetical protein
MKQLAEISKGIIFVASMSAAFYKAAVRCAISIKDYYPDARITLFTHQDFVNEKDVYLFEKIVVGIPVHSRAKLWALDKTPYDLTLYLDCDTEIWHEDISQIFDLLGDNDIAITNIREYAGKGTKVSNTENMTYHCGMFLYRKTEKVLEFMRKWWSEYLIQTAPGHWPYPEYNPKMKPWDQFTFWRLLKGDPSIKVIILPDDARWNFIWVYNKNETDKPIVVYHYTLPREQVNVYAIKGQSGSSDDLR